MDFPDPRIRDWPLPRVLITGGRVNVRVAPGYENRAIETVRAGMHPAVLAKGFDARGKKWLKIGLRDGRTGWIAAWFARPARLSGAAGARPRSGPGGGTRFLSNPHGQGLRYRRDPLHRQNGRRQSCVGPAHARFELGTRTDRTGIGRSAL